MDDRNETKSDGGVMEIRIERARNGWVVFEGAYERHTMGPRPLVFETRESLMVGLADIKWASAND